MRNYTKLRASGVIVSFLMLITNSFGQTYTMNAASNGTTVTTCGGTIIDQGGLNNDYANNSNYSMTFCSADGGPLRLKINFLNIEQGFDFLYVYDGNSMASPLLNQVSGFCIQTNDCPNQVYTSTGSCLTVRFTSDGSFAYQDWLYYGGFQLQLSCEPQGCNGNPPASDFCGTAPQICALSGYCGNTSAWYTIDASYTDSYVGNGQFCGSIENNSWVSFTASGTSATIDVDVTNCSAGNGIQLVLFQGNCGALTRVGTNCWNQFSGSQTLTFTGLTPGNNYYIMIDGFAGDVCDYSIDAISGIDVINIIDDISNVNSATYCNNDCRTLTLQTTGTPTSYDWYSVPAGVSGSGAQVVVCPTEDMVVYCELAGDCGASTILEFHISFNPNPPAPTIIGDSDYCQGQTAAISTQSFSSYSWSNGASTQATTVTTADNPITVTVTDANGCQGTSAPFSVTENPLPSPSITGDTEYCQGQNASISTGAFDSYSWSNGSSTQATTVTAANNPITVTVTDANGCQGTSAPFSVTEILNISHSETIEICQGQSTLIHGNIESVAGVYSQTFTTATCDSTATITLVVNSLPTISVSATDSEICYGESTDLSASGGSSYTWNNGLGASANHTVSPNTSTTYEVTGTNVNGCSNTAQIQITVNSLPTVSAGSDVSVCLSEDVTLFGSGAVSYVWDNGVIDGVTFIAPLGTTTYTVIGTDANGCSNSDNVDVTVNPLPTINAGTNQEVCEGEEVILSASGGVSYSWDNGVLNNVPFTPTLGNVVYTVTGTDANGCTNTATVSVNVSINPIADFTASPPIGSVPLTVLFTNDSSNGTSYTWEFGNGDGDITLTPSDVSTTYTISGEYVVYLTASNGLCNSTISTIIIVQNLPMSYTLPNIFTPNGDSSNDLFHLNLTNAKRVYIDVFNRWGSRVAIIDSVDPLNGWNGLDINSGEPAIEGVYFYNYEIEDLNGEVIKGHQFVHLKR